MHPAKVPTTAAPIAILVCKKIVICLLTVIRSKISTTRFATGLPANVLLTYPSCDPDARCSATDLSNLPRFPDHTLHVMANMLTSKNRGEAALVSACLRSVKTRAGEKRLSTYLATRPFPHFEAAAKPGLVVKTDADGTRTTGRFVY